MNIYEELKQCEIDAFYYKFKDEERSNKARERALEIMALPEYDESKTYDVDALYKALGSSDCTDVRDSNDYLARS